MGAVGGDASEQSGGSGAGGEAALHGELRLMWDHCTTWPLWNDAVGNLRDDPAFVNEALGLSRPLADDLRAWASAAEEHLGDGGTVSADEAQWQRQGAALDRWAEALVERLRKELRPGLTASYRR